MAECDRGAEAVVRWGGSAWVDGGGWEGGFLNVGSNALWMDWSVLSRWVGERWCTIRFYGRHTQSCWMVREKGLAAGVLRDCGAGL